MLSTSAKNPMYLTYLYENRLKIQKGQYKKVYQNKVPHSISAAAYLKQNYFRLYTI